MMTADVLHSWENDRYTRYCGTSNGYGVAEVQRQAIVSAGLALSIGHNQTCTLGTIERMKILVTADLHGCDEAFLQFAEMPKLDNYDAGILCGDLMTFPSGQELSRAKDELESERPLQLPDAWLHSCMMVYPKIDAMSRPARTAPPPRRQDGRDRAPPAQRAPVQNRRPVL